MTKARVEIWHDSTAENPLELGGWVVHSFSSRHSNHTNHKELGITIFADGTVSLPKDLEEDIEAGRAYWLSYFEHGACKWGRKGTMDQMPDFRWDGVRVAGLLRWEGPDDEFHPYTDEQIDSLLEEYTDWCNGYVYGYTIRKMCCCHCGHDHAAEVVDSYGGYIGDMSYLFDEIRRALKENDLEFDGRLEDLEVRYD